MKHHHHHTHLLSCSEVYTHLCDNLDSQLDTESCRIIKEHLKECDNCSAMLDSLKKTVYLYKNYPTPELPAKTRSELFAVIKIGKEKPKKYSRR